MKCTACGREVPPGTKACVCGNTEAEVRPAKGLFVKLKIERTTQVFDCPEHGRVSITSTEDGPPYRCPFCK